jgi:hypothetical protein
MDEGKEGINIPSCSISSGSGSKKTLSLLNCSLILPVVSLLRMAGELLLLNKGLEPIAGRGPAGPSRNLNSAWIHYLYLVQHFSGRFLFDFRVKWLGHYLLNYSF